MMSTPIIVNNNYVPLAAAAPQVANLSSSSSSSSNNVDFIIVGLGAAGATLFRTLSDAGYSVIGIEAGGNHDKDEAIRNPAIAGDLEMKYSAPYFYQQMTAPNENVHMRSMNYTTGRMLGGGSSINGMQYVTGSDAFWQQWSDTIQGAPQWKPARIRAMFKEMEHFVGVSGSFQPTIHGTSGKMHIRQAPMTNVAVDDTDSAVSMFAQSLSDISRIPMIQDYNDPSSSSSIGGGPNGLGVFKRWSLFQQVRTDGDEYYERASSSTDYLTDVLDSTNAVNQKKRRAILTNTTCTSVQFRKVGSIHIASGVSVLRNGVSTTLHANKEVLLCAGIYSNEILQRSGIGERSHLNSIGIPVVVDNPNVGRNSRNHLINTALYKMKAPRSISSSSSSSSSSSNKPRHGGGAESSADLYAGGAFLPNPLSSASQTKRGFQWIGVELPNDMFLAVFYNLQPMSQGLDRIQSPDPLQTSIVEENLLSDQRDLDSIKAVYKQQVPLLLADTHDLLNPPLSTIVDDVALETYIKDTMEHTHHWVGTNAMRPWNDKGVVDANCKVYGVRGLRVVDASVSAHPVDGNTAAMAFVVGYTIAKQMAIEYKK
jgi:choline dehydrogenase